MIPIISVDAVTRIRVDLREQALTDEQLAEMVKNGEIPQNVTVLLLGLNEITDVTPLSTLTDLQMVTLNGNQINDITPLSTLINLQELYLYNNQITDISPLANLTNLGGPFGALDLGKNLITDISPLANLTNLQWLDLDNNLITNLTPLENLVNLTWITVDNNPVTDEQVATLKDNLKKYSNFVKRVLGEEPVTVDEALEILKYLAGMESVVSEGNVAFYAARITGGDEPSIADVLEILKHLAGMNSVFGSGT